MSADYHKNRTTTPQSLFSTTNTSLVGFPLPRFRGESPNICYYLYMHFVIFLGKVAKGCVHKYCRISL